MRLVSYLEGDSRRFGTLEDGTVTDIRDAASVRDVADGLDSLASRLGTRSSIDERRLASPVAPLVRNIFCVGWNYLAHFEEGQGLRGSSVAQEIPDRPAFFTKATGTLIGPYDPVSAHGSVTDKLDWEVELAVVIGRGGVDIPEASALDHVLGYAVGNDVSARNVQREHGGQWFRGKSLDATCPIGPYIVTPDEAGSLEDRDIVCRVNGETVQSAKLGDMHFGVGRIIAELSRGLTLVPGDVILTGTPPGVGFARTPPRYLAVGDVIESEIAGIGLLRNEVVA